MKIKQWLHLVVVSYIMFAPNIIVHSLQNELLNMEPIVY
jgi:hypothetical protein